MDIFKKINDSINKVSESSVNFGNTLQLKSDLKKVNGEINEVFTKLGRAYFNVHQEGAVPNDEISAYIEQVKKLNGEAALIEEKIISLAPKVIKCSQCDAELSENAKFCGKCGGKAVAITQAKPISTTCSNCGEKVESDEAFCHGCGFDLKIKGV